MRRNKNIIFFYLSRIIKPSPIPPRTLRPFAEIQGGHAGPPLQLSIIICRTINRRAAWNGGTGRGFATPRPAML
jgi:hypothetical protein